MTTYTDWTHGAPDVRSWDETRRLRAALLATVIELVGRRLAAAERSPREVAYLLGTVERIGLELAL